MALHQLRSIAIGVPDPDSLAEYYTDFGLVPTGSGGFATTDGGEQLRVRTAPTRRLLDLTVGVDDADDLARVARRLRDAGHQPVVEETLLSVTEPVTGLRVTLEVVPRLSQTPRPAIPANGPGRVDRAGRAPGILRHDPVQPRKLGHAVVATTDLAAAAPFFTDLIGFKASDYIGDRGVFLRCSTDHHNLLLLSAPATFLHHTAWQVDDIDEVGRGASSMLQGHPERHVWGLGRHYAGSNFFWYLRDPAGNFSEYYADLDFIPEDAIWTPETHAGARGLYSWGPPPPPSFLAPDDLAELMAGASAGAAIAG
jgi:catechol 2,3-dioxygenase-like lactoylglutathione lyase family enzyme